jgi:transposase
VRHAPAAGAATEKKSLRAAEQDRAEIVQERAAFRERIQAIGAERLVFVDESGLTTKMTRRYARSPRGERARGAVPFGSWRRLTVVGALSTEGVVAAMSVEAATSTAVFRAYVERVLVPALRQQKPDAVVVMDNLRPHHATAATQALEAAGIGLLYIPPYSPDLSPLAQAALALRASGGAMLRREPIEPGWAKLKTRLRGRAARTQEALEAELGPALDAITPQDARGWFRHCGYALN